MGTELDSPLERGTRLARLEWSFHSLAGGGEGWRRDFDYALRG